MLLEVKNCINRDSKNKLWSKIEKNNHTKIFRQLVLVSYEICQIHSLDCASDLSQDKILFIYNMRLRPKYGKYLSQFQNFRPSFRATFVHWLFLKVEIHEGTSRGDMSRGVWDMSLVEFPRVTCRRDRSLVDVTRGHAIRGAHVTVGGKLARQTTSNCWKNMSSSRGKNVVCLIYDSFHSLFTRRDKSRRHNVVTAYHIFAILIKM